MSVLVAGVRQPPGGDLDFARVALERLGREPVGGHVVLEDLTPGTADVSRRLEDLRPGTLIVVGAVARGRAPGALQRRLVGSVVPSGEEVWPDEEDGHSELAAVDRVLQLTVQSGFGPARVVLVEVEPASSEPSETLSPPVADALEVALDLILAEIRRAPLLDLASELRDLMTSDPLERTPVVESIEALLAELAKLEREGRWGRTFAERDRLRLRISTGEHAGDFVGGLHWAMWWALMEELDRLQALEAASGRS